MTVTTALKDIADFWSERGIEPAVMYTLDGITYWRIEVPDDHEMLGHPSYVGLVVQEKLNWRHVLHKRMQPVLYSVKKGGHYADVRDPGGNRAVPMARSRELLKKALTHPETQTCPEIIPLKKSDKIHKMLVKAHRAGVDRILFFAADEFTETFSLEEALGTVWSH